MTSAMESEIALGLQLFANTGSGVWAVDACQRIVLWNRAAEEMLGFTADQVLSQPCYLLLGGRGTQAELSCQADCRRAQQARRQAPIPGFEMLARRQDDRAPRIGVSIVVVPGRCRDAPPAAMAYRFRLIGEAHAARPGSFVPQGTGFVTTDVTGLVSTWVKGSVPNYGVMLTSSPNCTDDEYNSSVTSQVELRPWLQVCYTVP